MIPRCDGNLFSCGIDWGSPYVDPTAPAFRLRTDKGFGAWRKPDGRTATEGECGYERHCSFWIVPDGLGITLGHYGNKRPGQVSNFYTDYIAKLGAYTETKRRDASGDVVSGQYHHFIQPWCDRLMFAQNVQANRLNGELDFSEPPVYFAPRAWQSDCGVDEDKLARRPYCSPETSRTDVQDDYGLGIWRSKSYADWRFQPKRPRGRVPEDESKLSPSASVYGECMFYGGICDGQNLKDMGIRHMADGSDPSDVSTKLLYTLAGNETDGWRPIYWRKGGTVPGMRVDVATDVFSGLCGAGFDWTALQQGPGEFLPSFITEGVDNADAVTGLEVLPGSEEGYEITTAFDLCVYFRAYKYKTADMTDETRPRQYLQQGIFGYKCWASLRVVAPCLPA